MENERIEAIVREVIQKMTENVQPVGSATANGLLEGLRESADRGGFGRENALPDSCVGKGRAFSLQGKLVTANGGQTYVAMPLSLAVKLIERIEAKAAEWDMRVVTAVSDASGRPVAIHCMDGAYIGSFDVALNKTYTSIAFQMSTAELGRLSSPGGSLYGVQFTNGGKIVIFGGGEVLKRDSVIVGALGVSGGSAEQDTALAAYGKKIFAELEWR